MTYTERLEIRLTEEEKRLVEEAAYLRRVKTAEWTRKVLVANARKTVEEARDG